MIRILLDPRHHSELSHKAWYFLLPFLSWWSAFESGLFIFIIIFFKSCWWFRTMISVELWKSCCCWSWLPWQGRQACACECEGRRDCFVAWIWRNWGEAWWKGVSLYIFVLSHSFVYLVSRLVDEEINLLLSLKTYLACELHYCRWQSEIYVS